MTRKPPVSRQEKQGEMVRILAYHGSDGAAEAAVCLFESLQCTLGDGDFHACLLRTLKWLGQESGGPEDESLPETLG